MIEPRRNPPEWGVRSGVVLVYLSRLCKGEHLACFPNSEIRKISTGVTGSALGWQREQGPPTAPHYPSQSTSTG